MDLRSGVASCVGRCQIRIWEGHKGDTLRQVANPDFVVPHMACVCEHCRSPLDPESAMGHEKRQVFDLPERPLLVTEHRASVHRCAHCRRVTKLRRSIMNVSPRGGAAPGATSRAFAFFQSTGEG